MEVVTFSIMANGRWCRWSRVCNGWHSTDEMGVICAFGHCYDESLPHGQQKCLLSRITIWAWHNPPYVLKILFCVFCSAVQLSSHSCLIFLACVWLIVPGKAVTGCWLRSVNLATLFNSASDRKRGDITQPWLPQLGQSGVSSRGWISACLPPCASPWHRSPYGS